MSAPETVLEYIKVLVWPTLVLVAIVLLRRELRGLVSRLRKFSFAGMSAEMDEAAAQAVEDATRATSELHADPAAEPPSTEVFDSLRVVAAIDPASAIRKGWSRFRRGIRAAAKTAGVEGQVRDPRFTSSFVQAMVPLGIPADYQQVTRSLNQIRNAVTHGDPAAVTPQTAQNFLDAAAEVYDGVSVVVARLSPGAVAAPDATGTT